MGFNSTRCLEASLKVQTIRSRGGIALDQTTLHPLESSQANSRRSVGPLVAGPPRTGSGDGTPSYRGDKRMDTSKATRVYYPVHCRRADQRSLLSAEGRAGMASDIVIRGAREHNLRDVSLVLPRGKFICLTGVSGSGKSSLAFDTLYAEGQRRYVESLSSYARQFLGQMPKPSVDRIDGLSPSISIQQKTGGPEPAVDGGHDHGNQRLSAGAFRPGRAGALPELRPRGGGPDPRTDRGADSRRRCPRGHRSWCWRRSSAGRRGNTRTSSRSWRGPAMFGRG